jgi:ectoine hydroxylase-related dioxygenase (phytanoyl-CoA dioxygenase family)
VLKGWSRKEGCLLVQAPVSLLEQLVAVRLHLDPCGADDGALRVVPGSHRDGRTDSEDREADGRAEIVCDLETGGALVMRPLLLHSSRKATGASRRRVLHFLFGPRELPYGLRWAAVV